MRTLIKSFNPEDFVSFDKKARKLNKELMNFSKKFTRENYNVDFNIPIKFTFTKTSVLGKLRIINNKPFNIIIDLTVLYYSSLVDKKFIYNILKHELIHYCLFVKGLNYQDGTKIFEHELFKHQATSSAATNKSKREAACVNLGLSMTDTYQTTIGNEIVKKHEYTHTKKNYNNSGLCVTDGIISCKKMERVAINLWKITK